MTASKIFMSPDFLTRFIEEYRELPCLWKVRCADYMNKVRDEAWEILMQVDKEKIPEADLNFVKKKIDSIRASFRKELRKVRESDRSGASADETYKPALWYLELLSFTAEQEKPRESKSNLEEDVNDVMNEEEERAETSEELTLTCKECTKLVRKMHKGRISKETLVEVLKDHCPRNLSEAGCVNLSFDENIINQFLQKQRPRRICSSLNLC